MARVALALVKVASACILGAAATDVTTPFEDEGQGGCTSASCHALLQRTTKPQRAAVFTESGSEHTPDERHAAMSQSSQQDEQSIARAIMQMGVGINKSEMGIGNDVELNEQSSSGDNKKEDLSFIGHATKKRGKAGKLSELRYGDGDLSEGEAGRAGLSSATFKVRAAMYNTMLGVLAEVNLGPGTTVALNEEGYAEVAELKDPQQMEFYVRRIVSQLGFRIVDQGGLHGFVPFYDGEEQVQSYHELEAEIKKAAAKSRNKTWVTDQVSGASAPLSQDGYEHVATLANNREMAEFVRRVASDLGLSVKEEGSMNGVAKWYSGDKAVQTFSELQGELINASMNASDRSWIAKAKPCPGTGHPSADELARLQGNSSWAGSNKATSSHPKKKQARRQTLKKLHPKRKQAKRQTLEKMKKGTVYVDASTNATEDASKSRKKHMKKETVHVDESANTTSTENAKPQAGTRKQKDHANASTAVDEALTNEKEMPVQSKKINKSEAEPTEKVQEHANASITEDEKAVSEHVQKSQDKKSKTMHTTKPLAAEEDKKSNELESQLERLEREADASTQVTEAKKSKTKAEAADKALEQEEEPIAEDANESPSSAAKSKSQPAEEPAKEEMPAVEDVIEEGEDLVEDVEESQSKLSKTEPRAATKTLKEENKQMLQELKEEESKSEPEADAETVKTDVEESTTDTEEADASSEANKASPPVASEMAKSGKVKAVHVAKAKNTEPGAGSKQQKVEAATQVDSSKQAHKKKDADSEEGRQASLLISKPAKKPIAAWEAVIQGRQA